MLQNPPSRPPDDIQTPEEAENPPGQQSPAVGSQITPRRTCSIHRGGHCCLASPQFQDFIAGYALGSSFVGGDSEQQQNSSSSSVEPASTILTTSASASGSTLDVLTTAGTGTGPEGTGIPQVISAVPLVTESVSSSSSEGTMRTNLPTSDISARTRAKPTSIMVKHTSIDTPPPSLPPGLLPTNYSTSSLPLTSTSVLSYSPTPVSTLASASRSLHDLPSSSSIAAATAFANLTPKARRRTFDSFALADENAARRDWKAINPPYKPESLPSKFGGNLRRATISGSGGMSYYGMGRDASAARWGRLMEAARHEDDARAGLTRALNNEGTKSKPMRRKTVQIYEPIRSSPLAKPSPPPSPPPKEDTTGVLSPVSSVSPAPSLSTITTQSQSQTVPSVVVSSAEADSAPTIQQSSSPPVSASVPAVLRAIPPSPSEPPPQPPKEVALAVKLFGTPPPVPMSVPRAQTPPAVSTASVPPPPPPSSSPLTAPPIRAPSPPTQAASTAPIAPTTAVVPVSAPTALPATAATTPPTTVTLPTPTNHVHLSRRTYVPPYKHRSLLSRLFSPFSHSHGSDSSTASHSSSVLQPPTFTSTKHPPSSSSNGGGLGRDITGTFVIDPLLVLPKGLFRAFSDDTFLGLSSTPTPSSELLGAGRGGGGGERNVYWDDSDAEAGVRVSGLRLKRSRSFDGGTTPALNRSAFARHHHGRLSIAETVGSRGAGVGGGGGEKEKEKKNLKLEVENGGMDVDVHIIPIPIPSTNIGGRRTRVQGGESGSRKERTTIELSLLSPTINGVEKGRGRGRSKSGQQYQVSEFPLVARIHAKSPRQPIHVTARTYTPTAIPLASSNVLSQSPITKFVAPQLSPSSPPPPPLLPPPPPSPATHPPTSPLPLSSSPTPTATIPTPTAAGVHPDRPPSRTSSIHTTHTTQTAYTARTTVTNITTPTVTAPTETGKGVTGPKRSGSTGRKLKKKRPSQQQKRMPTLTPYYYASADEAVAAAGGVGGGMEGTRESVGVEAGTGVEGKDDGGVEETSAPPYTRTHEPHEPTSEATNPPEPYDVVNPVSKPVRTPSATYPSNPAPVPVPLSLILIPSTSHKDSIDDNTLTKSNSKNRQQRPVMDHSNLTLSVPRTFHGPLSIHVQAGNLDQHIELSDALQRECVLVREGRCARGLFVGDFRKEFGSGGVGMEERGDEGAEVAGEEEVECVCGASEEVGEVEVVEVESKAKVKVGVEEARRVKRRPVVEFSMTTNGNPTLHPGSKESNTVNSTPQMTLHTRTKSTPPSGISPTPPTPTHARSQSIPSGLPFPASSATITDQLQPHRPSFLDVDPESLIHKTNTGGSNGLGQVGWKMTKVQNVNGRVRVLSEHQPIMKSPLRNGSGALATVPPVPPLPKSQAQTQTQTPAWVVPKSGLPGNGNGGDVHVRRLSVERKVFNPARGWEDSGSPTRMYVDVNGVGGGDAEESSSSGGGGGSGGDIDVKRRRRASAPVTLTRATSEGGRQKCTCGADAHARSKMRNNGIDARKAGRTEWLGDRIDISIGRGKVRLLYDDESADVFTRVGVVGAVKKEKRRWWKFGKGG